MSRIATVAVFSLTLAACGGFETYSSGPRGTSQSASAPTTPQPIGGRCMNDGHCAGSTICLDSWPNGYCTQSCATTRCPSGSMCVEFEDASVCLATCTASCRPGYTCASFRGVSTQACLPSKIVD